MDLRLGQTIIEFKIDLGKELESEIEEIECFTRIFADKGQKVAECIITKRALSRANYILAHKWSLIPFSLDFTMHAWIQL
jgi:hypothetical protein